MSSGVSAARQTWFMKLFLVYRDEKRGATPRFADALALFAGRVCEERTNKVPTG